MNTTLQCIHTRPLGLHNAITLDRDVEARLTTLEEYDLSFVANRLVSKQLLPEYLIEPAVVEFKRFAALFVLGHHGISVPCEEVDEVWHAFILYTQEYAEFCQRVAGRYLHHRPADSHVESPHAREAFLPLYRRYFDVAGGNALQDRYAAAGDCHGGGGCQGCDDCGVA